jgi:hypothetical protein
MRCNRKFIASAMIILARPWPIQSLRGLARKISRENYCGEEYNPNLADGCNKTCDMYVFKLLKKVDLSVQNDNRQSRTEAATFLAFM